MNPFRTFSKTDLRFVFLCWLAYTAAFVGRLGLSASILSLQAGFGFDKAVLGRIGTCYFVAYGCGQFLNAFLSRRYDPRTAMPTALCLSAACNAAMTSTTDIFALSVIWALNGLAQSAFWVCVIKTLARHVSAAVLPQASVVVSSSFAFGTILAYAVAALCTRAHLWRGAFLFAAAFLLVAAVCWRVLYGAGKRAAEDRRDAAPEPSGAGVGRRAIVAVVALFALVGVCNGFVKDGVNTWMPSILHEGFGVARANAVFLTIPLALGGIAGAWINKRLHARIASLAVLNAGSFLLSAGLCGLVLLCLRARVLAGVLVCFILLCLLSIMVNNVLTTLFVLGYRRVFDSALVAGLVNTFCYVGTASASWGLGHCAEVAGWSAVFHLLCGASLVAVVLSAVAVPVERRLFRE